MGYYTKVRYKLVLKSETPKEIIDIIKRAIDGDVGQGERSSFCVGDTKRPYLPKEIDHPFFGRCRWYGMFIGRNSDDEAYSNIIEENGICTLDFYVEFKDYDKESGMFSDMISKYVDFEKTEDPKIYCMGDNDEDWFSIDLNCFKK